ncbi:MAG: dihydrodipicolinate synthase family protein [Chthoniobacterales bacterium]
MHATRSFNFSAKDAVHRIKPGRTIEGISAVLLPFNEDNSQDLDSYRTLLTRTWNAGITPSVNMDTGYSNLLTEEERIHILDLVQESAAGRSFVAGAFVEGKTGDLKSLYLDQIEKITKRGGTPILFQCTALKAMSDDQVIALYSELGKATPAFLAFELGEMFVPFGRIHTIETYEKLMQIPSLKGAKHSSLDRIQEWERLELRDRVRPDFKVYTGNDLAIDMVMYGSDYLLGLSAFHPEAFALRDRLWKENRAEFFGLNDLLQYLGFFAFRPAVPAYKHNAAQFLKLRGLISTNKTHPKGTPRPESDIAVLKDIHERLETMMASIVI